MVRSIPSFDVDEGLRSQVNSLPRMVRRSYSTLGPVSYLSLVPVDGERSTDYLPPNQLRSRQS